MARPPKEKDAAGKDAFAHAGHVISRPQARPPTRVDPPARPASASAKESTPPPSPRSFGGFSEVTSFLWSVADLLRGDYKQADYGKVILPLTVLRRLDCVLDRTKAKVLAKHAELKAAKHPEGTIEKMLVRAGGTSFYNTSKFDFGKLKGDPDHLAANLTAYVKGFSANARDVIEQFSLADHIAKLDEANLLFQVVSRFADVDLHPEKVPNHVMGSIFEELIRRFAEASNETAGEHFTPREVIRLMVDLLFIEDEDVLRTKRVVRTLYDPAAGTGGMLSVAEEYLRELNPDDATDRPSRSSVAGASGRVRHRGRRRSPTLTYMSPGTAWRRLSRTDTLGSTSAKRSYKLMGCRVGITFRETSTCQKLASRPGGTPCRNFRPLVSNSRVC